MSAVPLPSRRGLPPPPGRWRRRIDGAPGTRIEADVVARHGNLRVPLLASDDADMAERVDAGFVAATSLIYEIAQLVRGTRRAVYIERDNS